MSRGMRKHAWSSQKYERQPEPEEMWGICRIIAFRVTRQFSQSHQFECLDVWHSPACLKGHFLDWQSGNMLAAWLKMHNSLRKRYCKVSSWWQNKSMGKRKTFESWEGQSWWTASGGTQSVVWKGMNGRTWAGMQRKERAGRSWSHGNVFMIFS